MPNPGVYKTILDIIFYLLMTVGIASVVVIAAAGIIYLTSGDNEEQVNKMKRWMTYGVGGLAIAVIGSVLIKLIGQAING